MIAKALNLDVLRWQGTNVGGTGPMLSAVGSAGATLPSPMPMQAANAEATIGIVADTDLAVNNVTTLKVLAFKNKDQMCGYLPDSTADSKDKLNVRDGHYTLWGPLHFLFPTQNGAAVNANARKVVNYLTGADNPPDGVDLIRLEASVNLVPQCAMRVRRDAEVGPLMSAQPPQSCGCYFEAKAGHTDCTQCNAPSDCPDGRKACNKGYCEVQ
jgi:hypothetical protein